MSLNKLYKTLLLGAIMASEATSVMANKITGPSSSESPYLVRLQPGVATVSVLTVGDAVNFKPDGVTPYRMSVFRMVSAHLTTTTALSPCCPTTS